MFKLIFGITLGAALMYLLDPSKGRERRETLTQRVGNGAGNLPQAKEQAHATVVEAKERAKSTIRHTGERVTETVEEARNEVNGLAKSTQERVDTIVGNGSSDNASNN